MAVYENPHMATIFGSTSSNTTTTYRDSAYTDFTYQVPGSSYIESKLSAPVSEASFHWRFYYQQNHTSYIVAVIMRMRDNSANDIIRLQQVSGYQYKFQLVRGTAGADIIDIVTLASFGDKTHHTFDVHVKIHATDGFVKIYQANNLIGEFNGDTVGIYTGRLIDVARLIGFNVLGISATFDAHYSEMFWGVGPTSPTVGHRCFSKAGTAAGFYTQWSGTFANVADGAVLDSIYQSGAPGDRQTYTFPALPAEVSEYGIKAVFHQGWGLSAGGVDFGFSHRIGSTDYDTAAVGAGAAIAPFQNVAYVSPATSVAWLKSEVNAMQSGLKAI